MKAFARKYLQPRHIIMYAQAIFLPVFLVLFSLPYFNRILTQELYSSNMATLSQTQESLDSAFSELDKILVYMAQNDSLSRYHMENSPSTVVSVLKTITATHPLINDIVIAPRDSNTFHTSTASVSVNDIESQHFIRDYIAAGLTGNDWRSTMNDVSAPIYWSSLSYPKATYSTYLYLISPLYQPLQTDGSISLRTTTLIINQSYIQNVFFSSQTASDEGMLLLSPNGILLTKQTSSRTDSYVEDICQYINENPDSFPDGYTQLSGTDIVMFASRSSKTGLIYVRFLSEGDAYDSLYNLQSVSLTIMVLAMGAGLILVAVLIRNDRTNIHSLADWVCRRNREGIEMRDDLVVFRHALDSAASRNDTLTHTAEDAHQELTAHLMTDLLSGNYSSEAAFRQDCLSVGLSFDLPYFAACSIVIEDSGDSTVYFDRIRAVVTDTLPKNYLSQLKNMLLANKLILLINSDNNDPMLYKSTMELLKSRLLEQENLTVSIGMGGFYDSWEKACKSYYESMTALDYRLVYGKNSLITPDMVNSNTPELTVNYPSYDLDLLDTAIKSGNTDTAATILRRIQSTVKLKNYNLHVAKYICYDISSILKKHIDTQSPGSLETSPVMQVIANLTDSNAVDNFFAATAHWLHSVSKSSPESVGTVQTGAGAQLVEYADAHCLSYDFQIKNMAEHFSISPQYMRKLFKTHTGMSISEYVSNKRLEKSMHLLIQTDMSLQDIVAEIGNSDISGFVRFFKQKTGLTPGQYRKEHKQSN